LFLSPDGRKKRDAWKKMDPDDKAGAERANCRDHESAMSAQPVHPGILGAASPGANAILLRTPNREISCDLGAPRYFSRPRTPMRRVDLPTWSRLIRGLISE
jgi:hypothetical protein